MAKLNRSDYLRWAERRSTEYLKSIIDEFAMPRIKAKLQGEIHVSDATTVLDRKIEAAIKVVESRRVV